MKSTQIYLAGLFVIASSFSIQSKPEKNTPLYEAVHAASAYFNKNYLAEIDRLIEEKVNLNAQNSENKTALHYAVESKNIVVVKKLIAAGAYLEVQAYYGWTPLHWAVYVQSPEIVQLLLDAGAQVNFENNYDFNALALAIYYNHIKSSPVYSTIARILIDAGAILSHGYGNYDKYLYETVAQNDIAMLAILTELGISVQYRIDLSNTSEELVTIVDGYKINKRTKDVDGMTPLHKAAKNNLYETAKLLLKAGALKNVADASGSLPLDYAQNQLMKELLS